MRDMRVFWGLWCNQTLPQGEMWESFHSDHEDEKEEEMIEWRMGKENESCERSEQIWRNRFKIIGWEVQWKWMKMMKKWRCVLLNEVIFVRDEKRESEREVREFDLRIKRNVRRWGWNMERVMEFQKVCEVIKKAWRKVYKRVCIKKFKEEWTMKRKEDEGVDKKSLEVGETRESGRGKGVEWIGAKVWKSDCC